MNDKCEEGWKRNTVLALAYAFRRALRGQPGLSSPSDGQIAINSTFSFTTNAFWDSGFNPDIFLIGRVVSVSDTNLEITGSIPCNCTVLKNGLGLERGPPSLVTKIG